MTDLADRLEAFIPRGDGYNSDYAITLTEAVEELRAQSAPAEVAQGEAVKVAGYQYTSSGGLGGKWNYDPLMTVAQHNRIVAAMAPPSPDAELVELLTQVMGYAVKLEPIPSFVIDRIDAKLASLRN
jgi:hypothetical protein